MLLLPYIVLHLPRGLEGEENISIVIFSFGICEVSRERRKCIQ